MCANSVIFSCFWVLQFFSVNNGASHQILIDHDWSTSLLISGAVHSSNKIVQNQDPFPESF